MPRLPRWPMYRGVLGLDRAALAGIAAVPATGGRVEVLASLLPSDGVAGLDCLDETAGPAIREAWFGAGLVLESMAPATAPELAASGSS